MNEGDITRYDAFDLVREDVDSLDELLEENDLPRLLKGLEQLIDERIYYAENMLKRNRGELSKLDSWAKAIKAAQAILA